MNTVHQSKVGTFHPAPHQGSFVEAWTINDTRGTIDGGPACDECGACECEVQDCCDRPNCCDVIDLEDLLRHHCPSANHNGECIGLSFAFVCLDGGDSLCRDCAEKAGIQIVPCDCE